MRRRTLYRTLKRSYGNSIIATFVGNGSNACTIVGGDYFYTSPKITNIFVDDKEIPLEYQYTFGDKKEHTVVYMMESGINNLGYFFSDCTNLKEVYFYDFDSSNLESCSGLFNGCSKLTYVETEKLKTNNVNDMSYMFDGCTSLTELDLYNFDVRKCVYMSYMFADCKNITTLDLRSFYAQICSYYTGMFDGCSGLMSLYMGNAWYPGVTTNMFRNIKTSGVFYYDGNTSDFNKFISILPSTWTSVKL